ncbi:hypothetical protein N7532_007224 [Penicillium argentinense]|uniref:Uncharacterized protein n=1 Tax=Penicillium argentinense TaxID=1131581 RepID=A0A9W9K6T4_9EURO|nr:uncharacterized protein N7532_007181 [Penicillium argentinense]XP_056473083.1 uncharacterized protein N7532_007224 [Penicillium argentinense]KAJ5094890.1 hypothetical protein N7532_007181 [Penicillium argentinense]KAJ5094933.1 hypothetical protein N7532_007224 [Penicillium argentinense]
MERCPGTDPSDTTATKPRPPNTHDSGGFVPFPGAAWFKTKPNSPIIDAMGKRLVEEGCKAYKVGPGPQWTGADQDSYKLWQQKLRFKGANADGWPGQVSWDKLKVPN